MDKDLQKKISSCKGLAGKTIADVVAMPDFLANLAAYLEAQRQDRAAIKASYAAMHKAGGAKGYKLPSHVCDKLLGLDDAVFAAEFLAVVTGQSNRPFSERRYIEQIGRQAYSLTVAEIICKEFPELRDTLIPKSKSN